MFKQTEFRTAAIYILITALCMGCDTASKQQQAEDARKAATAVALEEAGKKMHGNTKSEVPSNE